MKRLCIISAIAAILLPPGASARGYNIPRELDELDREIDHAPASASACEVHLKSLEEAAAAATDPRDRFAALGQLYDAYFTYQYDKALDALNRQEELARSLGDPVLANEAMLHKAVLWCNAGMYLESSQMAASLDTTLLTPARKIEYWDFRQKFYYDFREYSQSDGSGSFMTKVYQYRDSVIAATPDGTFLNTRLRMQNCIDSGLLGPADSLCTSMLGALDPSSHNFAIMAYYKGVICRDSGDPNGELHWFIRSATRAPCPAR